MFVLPINAENEVRDPWMVVVFMAINILAFVASILAPDFHAVLRHYGFIPADPHVYTLFTSMFLHAGFWHIAGNMWFLWMFGNQVENTLGKALFSATYLAAGICAAVGFFPAGARTQRAAGRSFGCDLGHRRSLRGPLPA